jgi:hypothetical protein
MRERGLSVDHTTLFRWVQRYAPEINKRIRPHLKMSGTSYRVDETYIKVGTHCKGCVARNEFLSIIEFLFHLLSFRNPLRETQIIPLQVATL